MREKLAFVGDLHGDSLKLSLLLSQLTDSDRRLVFLGDYIDHGSDSKRVLEMLIHAGERTPKPVFLSGNHEIGLLAFLAGKLAFVEYAWMGGIPTIRNYVGKADCDVRAEMLAAFPASHFEFLSACVPFLETVEFIASHAGVNPDCPANRDLLNVTLTRHAALFERPNKVGKLVICGHYLQSSHKPLVSNEVVCLNTGCGNAGGPASALLYPEMTVLQA